LSSILAQIAILLNPEMIEMTTRDDITTTFTRLAEKDKDLAGEVGALEDGWICAADLLIENSPALEEGLRRAALRYDSIDDRTAAAFLFGHYVWYLTEAAVAAYLSEKRVPDLALDNVALRYSTYTWEYEGTTGESQRIDARFLSGRFAALPNDPAAGQPDVMILPDVPALREWMRDRLETHLALVVEKLYARTRLSRRALWNLAADACASQFLHLDEHLGCTAQGRAEGLAFIRSAQSEMRHSKTEYITLEYKDQSETFCSRGGCCRYYMVPGKDTEKCWTCVLRPQEEQKSLHLNYMAERYAARAAGQEVTV
jgi:hypothetical protein